MMMKRDERPFVFAKAPTLGRREEEFEPRLEPFRNYLERALGRPVVFRYPTSYQEVLDELTRGEIDAAMLGELAARRAEQEGEIEPLVAAISDAPDSGTYRSTFVTRIDSGIHDLDDLRGVRLGLSDEQSTSGYLIPRAMLREAGIDPDTDLEIVTLGNHRAVVEAVIAGEVAAGALHEIYATPPSLDRGPDYARLRFLARSRPIPRGPLVVRKSLDRETRARLAEAMLRIHEADPVAAQWIINSGLRFTVAPPKSSPTLKSIAALAGVSYATVSRVVNRAGYVAPKTAERVSAIVKEVGYVPNGNARLLQGQQVPLVGFLQRATDRSGMAERARDELETRGIPLVICPVAGDFESSSYFGLVRDRRIGAVLVAGDFASDPALIGLARQGYVIVGITTADDVLAPGMLRAPIGGIGAAVAKALRWPG
jgi:phosphonate transport system substrate-binding protein